MNQWLSDDEQHTWRTFAQASRLLHDRLERELLTSADMPPTYYELLVLLSEADGQTMRMSELAHWTDSKPSRISHAINKLEQKGWVRREHSPHDRRGWYATLTPQGQTALHDAAPKHVASVREHLIDQLTPKQLRQLADISQTLLDHLQTNAAQLERCSTTCLEDTVHVFVGDPATGALMWFSLTGLDQETAEAQWAAGFVSECKQWRDQVRNAAHTAWRQATGIRIDRSDVNRPYAATSSSLKNSTDTKRNPTAPTRPRACSLEWTVTPPEEVRPMNAEAKWGLPLPVTVGRLT